MEAQPAIGLRPAILVEFAASVQDVKANNKTWKFGLMSLAGELIFTCSLCCSFRDRLIKPYRAGFQVLMSLPSASDMSSALLGRVLNRVKVLGDIQ
jgi:hypothetical protein